MIDTNGSEEVNWQSGDKARLGCALCFLSAMFVLSCLIGGFLVWKG